MRRRLLAPEIIQSSAMDCGPAALKSALEGFGIAVSYASLRTACATDVDGTSIDTLELLANQHGLRAEQVLIPKDHLPLPQGLTLPAIVVTRMPHGGTHFVVVWSATRTWVQVMDPAVGRRFLRWERFLEEVYVHEALVPAAAWREWAGTDGFLAPLRARLRALLIPADALIENALAESGVQRLLHLDAALRMLTALRESGAVAPGPQASALLSSLVEAAGAEAEAEAVKFDEASSIPPEFYSARTAPCGPDEEPMVRARGAVLVQLLGRAEPAAGRPDPPAVPSLSAGPPLDEQRAIRGLWAQLGSQGRRASLLLLCGVLGSAAGGTVDVLLLQALLDAVPQLGLPLPRLGLLLACALLCLGLLALDVAVFSGALRVGRLLEIRLRRSLHERLPQLGDAYFSSRPVSDLSERSHQIFRVREVPLYFVLAARALCQILMTGATLILLDPRGAPLVCAIALATIGIPLLLQPLLVERDLRARSHRGALMRFHLDTLLGTTALRAHDAESALRAAQEDLLCDWAAARRALGRAVLFLVGGQGLLGMLGVAALWFGYLERQRDPSGLLLLAYLSLSLPTLGQSLTVALRQYPALRSILLRLLEPLQAPLVDPPAAEADSAASTRAPSGRQDGVEIVLSAVEVRAAGQAVLRDVNLSIRPGEEIAIVGASGAGKSTLLGLLLGFQSAAAGSVRVDGAELTGAVLARLRSQTAWVDPTVQLFNRTLLENLRYGSGATQTPLAEVLDLAQLEPVVARLPAGLQTLLGEGGALVSGGEGQRVRLGRALLRPAPRLVLLDEPFRGLGSAARHELLRRTRERMRAATLLCVTHDMTETLSFDRVLVIDGGQIVEEGAPAELATRPDGRYRALLAAQERAKTTVWGRQVFRKLRLEDGQLHEEP